MELPVKYKLENIFNYNIMKKQFKRYSVSGTIIIFIISYQILFSQESHLIEDIPTSNSSNSTLQELKNDLKVLIENPDFADATLGVSIFSPEYGEFIFRHNDTKNFLPASINKIITSTAALELLGSEFTYNTKLFLDGYIQSNGEFNGNIIIRGSGDPTMNKYFYENPLDIFEIWIKKLDSLGIRSIRGNIIGDDNYFDDVYYAPGWSWDDFVYEYSSQVNALTFNDNKIDISVISANSVGEYAMINVFPENSYARVINNILTVDSTGFTRIMARRDANTNIIELFGTIMYDSTADNTYELSVTIDNPTLFFLSLFKSSLERHNIRFRGALLDIDEYPSQRINYSEMMLVSELESTKLSEIIKVINKSSNNLMAEIVFKTIAKEISGIGSFEKASEQIYLYLLANGVNPERVKIVDGSGLSRLNLASPALFTNLLSNIYRSEKKDEFIQSLARPGENGTLSRRMRRSRAEYNVFAKTGSMNSVSTLAGFVNTRDNETLAFTIMIQNFTVPQSLARNLQDLICMRLASFSRGINNE